ncbi:MAG: type I-MYXAN CRISPR-associated protein Cas6/Cmx6 [Rhodocyclaceae bacterium]|nr:type I-MYXAN CRISPR-associated protein Cas6/Cmx6 [Rhodocyclaceae bacterium]
MTAAADAEFIDLAFPLRGGDILADYAEALRDELVRVLPWLADEPLAAVLPLARIAHQGSRLILSGRTRLILRLPMARVEDACGLAGRRLDIGDGLDVGAGGARPLWPSEVLYSTFVDLDETTEGDFVAACREALDALGLERELVCGKARRAQTREGPRVGHSVMIYGLKAGESLRLQRMGLGQGRLEGRGVFVPHKSVAAVGE